MVNDNRPKWSKEKKVLKKLQMHFNFVRGLHRRIHHEAADADLAPSDVVRRIVGLSYSKIQRPRIGLSFNDDDLVYLMERYHIEEQDKDQIRKRVMDEVAIYFNNDDT